MASIFFRALQALKLFFPEVLQQPLALWPRSSSSFNPLSKVEKNFDPLQSDGTTETTEGASSASG